MGQLMALLSGVAFAVSNTYNRRSVYFTKESFSPLAVSLGIGILLLFVAMLVSGSASSMSSLSWWGLLSLSAAGIIHFVIGRMFNYTGLRLVGANITAPLMATNVLFAAVLAWVFLGETLSVMHGLGIAAVFVGLALITSSSGGTGAGKIERRTLWKGVGAGLAAGLCYGISPLFVRVGVREIGSPYAAGFVSYAASGVVVVFLLVRMDLRRCLLKIPSSAVPSMITGGVSVTAAQILRYVALEFLPVNVVTPLTSTNNLFTPFMSWIVNRKLEVFSVRVMLGTVAMLTGVLIVMFR